MKSFVVISFALLSTVFVSTAQTTDKSGCKHNDTEDIFRISPRIIHQYGYPVECHFVTTEDGYILGMHRIPHGKNREADSQKMPVLLQHGLFGSSADWLLAGPNISLGFLLADQGYDVWLGNLRGNTYSRSHVKLNTNEYKFWNFSFHENGIYDVPAEIDYILQHTSNTQLKYIGHSMGNTMFYVMGSMRPEYNKKISGQISLAPVVYLTYTSSLLFRVLAPFSEIIKKTVDFYFHGEALSRTTLVDAILKTICVDTVLGQEFCRNIFFFVFGTDPAQVPASLLPAIVSDIPSGIAIKTLIHNLQFINSGRFCHFDYGRSENLVYYNSEIPPDYNVSAISAKIATVYGKNDPITSDLDSARFYPQLPNPAGLYTPAYSAFTHLDFLWATNVSTLLVEDVLELLKSFDSKDQAPNIKHLIPVDLKSLSGKVQNFRNKTNFAFIDDVVKDFSNKGQTSPTVTDLVNRLTSFSYLNTGKR